MTTLLASTPQLLAFVRKCMYAVKQSCNAAGNLWVGVKRYLLSYNTTISARYSSDDQQLPFVIEDTQDDVI